MFYKKKPKKKKEVKIHDTTPLIIVELMSLFDKLSAKCSAKPKVKKNYCYTDLLPKVLRLKSVIMDIYRFHPVSVDDLINEVTRMEICLDNVESVIIDIKNLYSQHIYMKDEYDRLEESVNSVKSQLMKWRNCEKGKIRKLDKENN